MASMHPIHRPEATYGQPEVHYPAEPVPYLVNPDDDPDHDSLIGEAKGDETTAEEWAMSEEEFEKLVLTEIGVKDSKPPGTITHVDGLESVLLPIPKSVEEEKELHEKVMANLRKHVAALEEEEMFESSMGGAGGGQRRWEDHAAGLGGQLSSADVKNLLRANVNEVWKREKERSRERELELEHEREESRQTERGG